MTVVVNGKTVETDKNGYMVNLDDWNEEVAKVIAEQEGIAMTPEHWDMVNFLREEFVNNAGSQPNTRNIIKAMQDKWPDKKVDNSYLYKLFPRDPSKQGGRIAGLPESRRKGGY